MKPANFFLFVFGTLTLIAGSAFAVEKPFGQPVNASDLGSATNSKSISERFKHPGDAKPDFQRHVAPLLGRLGCNGRACHGSFQGQGGFRLSLFGYDFAADHQALMDGRVDVAKPAESLVLTKPTDEDNHEGGLRYEVDGWEYNLLRGWIEAGAQTNDQPQKLSRLVVEPSRLRLADAGQNIQLRATAHWADGTVEDVTELCRFETNDGSIADVNKIGQVSTHEIAGDTHVVVSYDSAVVPVPVVHPIPGGLAYVRPPTPTRIDELVVDKLERLGIQPSELSDDAMFLRRVSLDITGTLPTPEEIRSFLADESPNKRQAKIEQLLQSPAYTAWWTTFFCDMTENNTQQLRNVSNDASAVSKQWYQWIYRRVEENVPYDQLVEGIVMGVSRKDGENYRDYCERMSSYFQGEDGIKSFAEMESMPYYWMRREFQERETKAISFAHAFLGLRIQCAQCHKHPFDQWSQDDFKQFAKFFSGGSFRNNYVAAKEDKAVEEEIYKSLGIDPKAKNQGNNRKALAEALSKGKTVPFSGLEIHSPRPGKEETDEFRKKQNEYKQQLAEYKKSQRENKGQAGKPPVAPKPEYQLDQARLLGSETVKLADYEDTRLPLMDWIRNQDNPYFAKALVNRVWARYFGVGIVDPADDLNLANPPSNAELLDYLAQEFIKHDFDLKWLHREITNSRTYQLGWKTNDTNANDRRNFSRALPRRLPAEVVFDAVNSAASDPKTNREFRDEVEHRAISTAGTDGYNAGKKNQGVNSSFALQVFGRSERSSSCDCDRSEETSLIQTVYLQNDRDIHTMLTQRGSWVNELEKKLRSQGLSQTEQQRLDELNKRIGQAFAQIKKMESGGKQEKADRLRAQVKQLNQQVQPLKDKLATTKEESSDLELEKFVEEAYLRTVSRFPTQQETARCIAHIQEGQDLVSGVTGVMWALVNTKEFIVNH